MQKYEFTGHLNPLPPGIKLPLQISGEVCLAADALAMERELERWKRIATFLADCHAASAEIIRMRKSSSKSDRARAKDLCDLAWRYLTGDDPGHRARSIEPAIERLQHVRLALGKDGKHS